MTDADLEKEIDECGKGRREEHILIRFGRKKYKCIMMFLCIIALILNTTYLIIEKSDSANINRIINAMPNATRVLRKLTRILKESNFEQFVVQNQPTTTGKVFIEYDP